MFNYTIQLFRFLRYCQCFTFSSCRKLPEQDEEIVLNFEFMVR